MLQEYFKSGEVLAPELPENSLHPIMVYSRDIWDTQDFKLYVEGQELCEAEDLVLGLEFVLILHYIFNITYSPKAKRLLLLLQVCVLGIKDKEPVPKSVTSLLNKLAVAM